MRIEGVTIDIFISRAQTGFEFWRKVIGRVHDLAEGESLREWRLAEDPEVNLRVIVDPSRAGYGQVGLGVKDLDSKVDALRMDFEDVPTAQVKPGVIAMVTMNDPDGNTVTVWQDLLGRAN
jgi:hypothetical protein